MKFLFVCFISLFSLSFGSHMCPSKVMCPGTWWHSAPEMDEPPEYDPSCLRIDGYSSWFILNTATAGEIEFQMQARQDVDFTQNSQIDWAFYRIPEDQDGIPFCEDLGEPELKGCTEQANGVYDMPTVNVDANVYFAVLVKSVSRVAVKVTSLNPATDPVFNCGGLHQFTTQSEIVDSYQLPTPPPTTPPPTTPPPTTPPPTKAPTKAPTNAPTWPAHQFVPKLVRHDPWYNAYTNAPTAAGPIEYDIPTPPSPVYVPATKGKTVFPYCVGFGHSCQAAYNLY